MKYIVETADEYIEKQQGERRGKIKKLRQTILENLDIGFKEGISYGMIGYFVPHSIYPSGYHVNPSEPLPFVSLASQKKHIAIYHNEIYMNEDLKKWFIDEYTTKVSKRLDMAKSCIRFKDNDEIPYDLIGKLVRKTKIKDYINLYQSTFINK